MNNKRRQQTTDQSIKGGIAGIILFLMMKAGADAGLIAMATPVITGLLSWVSTKIGDPELASFIGTVGATDGKCIKVAPKKAVAKKTVAKKAVAKKTSGK